jgi:hypothetical protein
VRTTWFAEPDEGYEYLGTRETVIEYKLTLSNGWTLNGYGGILWELDLLLAKVNLSNPNQKYLFEEEETERALTGTESVIVTHEGPFPPDEDGEHPLRFVYTSNGPWTWDGESEIRVAHNLNSITNGAIADLGEAGAPADTTPTNEPDVINSYDGSYWSMMKSVLLLPAGTYTKAVKRYEAPAADAMAFDFPAPSPNGSDAGGEYEPPQEESELIGANAKQSFGRGDWITITKLTPAQTAQPSIDTDTTRIDQDNRRIDR